MAELNKYMCGDLVCVMNSGIGRCTSPITVHPGSVIPVCKGRPAYSTDRRGHFKKLDYLSDDEVVDLLNETSTST